MFPLRVPARQTAGPSEVDYARLACQLRHLREGLPAGRSAPHAPALGCVIPMRRHRSNGRWAASTWARHARRPKVRFSMASLARPRYQERSQTRVVTHAKLRSLSAWRRLFVRCRGPPRWDLLTPGWLIAVSERSRRRFTMVREHYDNWQRDHRGEFPEQYMAFMYASEEALNQPNRGWIVEIARSSPPQGPRHRH